LPAATALRCRTIAAASPSRRPAGENVAIFNPNVLSNPGVNCQLTYRLDGDQIVVEKQPGVVWLTLAVASLPRGRI